LSRALVERRRALTAVSAPSARHALAFFGSRVANGLLGLAQATLVARALSLGDAARFFLWWTAVWLLATVFKFGLDGILPRVVAETPASGSLPQLRRPLAAGLVLGGALSVPVLAMLHVPLDPWALVLALALALEWAFVLLCGGYLRAIGRADLAGATTGVIWPLAVTSAALVALATRPSWIELEVYTFAAASCATAVTVVVARRLADVRPVRDLLTGPDVLPLEADVVGGALLSGLYESMIWLPVVLAGLLQASTAMVGAVFLSTRLAGVLSWSYQGIVAALSPRVARALAARQIEEAGRLIRKGSALGALATVPPAAAMIVFAGPLLGALDHRYRPYALVLSLLALARAVDAASGPVGEALLVARHTWLDAALMASGILAGCLLALALPDARAAIAAAAGASAGFVLANVLRVVVVGRLLRRGWA
jgi:O-antigen/teichoic acid export membrane protein